MIDKNEFLTAELNKLNLDIDFDYLDLEDVENFDQLRDEIENNNLLEIEIIYYSTAIEYLANNDASLNESMSIASELCYTPDNINSEILASLHATQELQNDFYSSEGEIDQIFEDLEEAITEEEEEENA